MYRVWPWHLKGWEDSMGLRRSQVMDKLNKLRIASGHLFKQERVDKCASLDFSVYIKKWSLP